MRLYSITLPAQRYARIILPDKIQVLKVGGGNEGLIQKDIVLDTCSWQAPGGVYNVFPAQGETC